MEKRRARAEMGVRTSMGPLKSSFAARGASSGREISERSHMCLTACGGFAHRVQCLLCGSMLVACSEVWPRL
eukprot:2184882-Rhodomonas_salina.1